MDRRQGAVRHPLRGPLHRHLIIAVPHEIPDSPGAVEGEAPQQDHPGLCARPNHDAGPREPRLEALAQEAREQAAHQAVFEVQLDDTLRVGAFLGNRGAEGDSAERGCGPPILQLFASPPATGTKIIERLRPACRLEGGVPRIEAEEGSAAYLSLAGGGQRQADPRKGGADYIAHLVRINSNPLA